MKYYAVSLVWMKDNNNGTINLANSLCDIEANSEEEAFGKVYELNKKEYPEHKLHIHGVIELDKN